MKNTTDTMKNTINTINDMKVKISYCYREELREKFVAVSEIAEMICLGRYEKTVNALREEVNEYRCVGRKDVPEVASRLPVVSWSCGEEGYNGLVMLTLPCTNKHDMSVLREKMNAYLNVLCTFRGASGCSLKVVMAFDVVGTSLSELTDEQQRMFRAHAYCRARAFLLANTGLVAGDRGVANGYNVGINAGGSIGSNSDRVGADGAACRISFDEDCYLNDNVTPILLPVPDSMPDRSISVVHDVGSLSIDDSRLPGYTDREMAVTNFNIIRRHLGIDAYEGEAEDVVMLAESCCKAGIDEEIAVKATLAMNRFCGKTTLVRTAFEQAYSSPRNNNRCSRAARMPLSKFTINMELLRHYMTSRYRFRQNIITGSIEYMEVNRYADSWHAFTDRDKNTICMEILRSGIDVWDRDVARYVNSSFVEEYDPIAQWLSALPEWDGRDRVGELASLVKSDWEAWPRMFRVWMRSMVSQWKGSNTLYGATMVLMFTGRQGTGKSTFFKRLMPPELMTYYLDRLDFTNKKEAEKMLMRFCLINLDEYDQISTRQTAFLKHILQKSSITYRKMYQNDIEQRRRYATFCATTNSDAPLADETGSRRYLVVEVTDCIDNSQPIDYAQLYAQVLAEVHAGMPSFFDGEMESEIQDHNQNYTQQQPFEVLFEKNFRIPAAEEAYETYTATDILMHLKQECGLNVSINMATVTKLGRYLNGRGIRSVRTPTTREYHLVLVSE